MGLIDKVKDTVKSADKKLGNVIDKEKIDSEIRKQESAIDDLVKEIGEKVVAALRDGKDIFSDEVVPVFNKIKECETKIEELKTEKEAIGNRG